MTHTKMNEVEKMYSNAGLSNMWVERYDDKEIWHKSYSEMINTMMKLNDWTRQVAIDVAKKECKKEFPPFTTEKQLELIKWLINEVDYITMWHFNNSKKPYDFDLGSRNSGGETFEDALAQMINNLWQDLTEEEQQQVKGILE